VIVGFDLIYYFQLSTIGTMPFLLVGVIQKEANTKNKTADSTRLADKKKQ